MTEENIIKCENLHYKKIHGEIKPGDLYYLVFFDRVYKMDNHDYGEYHPNKMGGIKVKKVKKL